MACAAAGPPIGLLPPAGMAKVMVKRAVVTKKRAVSCMLADVIVGVGKVIDLMTKALRSSKC